MRVIIRYCLPSIHQTTFVVEVEPILTISQLKQKILERCKITQKNVIFKIERDDFIIRLVDGFSFDFYEIIEKVIIYVESIDSKMEEEKLDLVNQRYFGKLGLLSSIKEEGFSPLFEKSRSSDKRGSFTPTLLEKRSSFGTISNEVSSARLKPVENSESDEYVSIKMYSKDLESLLKEAKLGNLKNIEKILNNYQNKSKILNDLGSGGWNILHFAIFCGHVDIVKRLIEIGIDVNKNTNDGWTPLQLSIHRNHLEIAKLILLEDSLEIDKLTIKGTALHIASSTNKKNFVTLLLSKKANTMIKDFEENTPLDVTTSPEIQDMIQTIRRRKTDIFIPNPEHSDFVPPNPPIIMGYLYKTGPFIFNLKMRFFVLDPYDGTFIRYKDQSDHPFKPLEVVPLKDIIHLQKIERSWFMRNDLIYFEFIHSSRQILAAKLEGTVNAWVTYLYKASVYSYYIEEQIKKKNGNLTEISEFSSRTILNKAEQNEIIEIRDEIPLTEDSDPLKYYNKPFAYDIPLLVQKEFKTRQNKLGPFMPSIKEYSHGHKTSLIKSDSLKIFLNDNNTNTEEKNYSEKNNISILTESLNQKPRLSLDSPAEVEKVGFKSFIILKTLGSGSFGKVFLVRKKNDEKIYAMKVLKKKNLILKKQLRYAISEANILKKSDHPFILTLHYSFQTLHYLYLVIDYCPGGDLALKLAQRVTFTEDVAKFYIAEVILGLERLHDMNIIYRDLKPENILLGEDGHIKLADFGLSKEGIGDNDKTKSFCGSPAYLAPEIIQNKGASKSSDIYAIGAVLYEFLTGQPPYYNEDIPRLYRNIKEGKLTFPNNVSKEAKNLMIGLLSKDPKFRLGVTSKKEIKRDPFFNGMDWDKMLRKEYLPPILDYEVNYSIELDSTKKPLFVDTDYEESNSKINRVINFSFSRNKD